MPLTNTSDRFGTVSKSFHWLTAIGILVLLPLGLIANDMPYETSEQLADKAWMFSLHKTVGGMVFLIALARIAWALSQPAPGPLHPARAAETLAADTVHWLLYGSLVLVPLSGWISHAAAAGFAPIWWPLGQDLPLVHKSETTAALFGGAHWVLTRVLALALLLHIAAALKHHAIDKDATLRRIWFGNTTAPVTARAHSHARPAALALVIWTVALAVGAALGAYAPDGNARPTAAPEPLRSEWRVQEGTLAITVTQLSSEVTGQFADWTASIGFDETTETGLAGTVEVTIAIGSLRLGAFTGQAMGPDYFNGRDFPTATFRADIVAVVDGFEAQGTVTIRDRSIPLTLPFGLSIDGDSAWMTAGTSLDRRDFGIGDNMADESSLKFRVAVDIDLMATRAGDR